MDEKRIVTAAFSVHLKEHRLPSFSEITELKAQYPELRERTCPQIKTWIHNQNKTAVKGSLIR